MDSYTNVNLYSHSSLLPHKHTVICESFKNTEAWSGYYNVTIIYINNNVTRLNVKGLHRFKPDRRANVTVCLQGMT